MGWRKLGIGLFIAGALLIVTGFGHNLWLGLVPAAKVAGLSVEVRDCATRFDGLSGTGLTRARAHEVTRACDVAITVAPSNCSAFLSAAGRAGFTAEQGIGTGRPSDLEPYEASRRDAIANRRECDV